MQTNPKRFVGLSIIVIGIIILVNTLHLHVIITRFLLPVAFGWLAFHFYQRNQRFIAGLFFALAIILFFKINIFGLIVAILFIYVGYRLLQKNDNHDQVQKDTAFQPEEANVKKSLIGEIRYTDRFELKDFSIQQAIGDVKIDLTKALVQNGETVIIVNGWVGNIDIYVPYDLPVMVDASVFLGELEIFDKHESGVNRHITIKSPQYDEAAKKS